MKKLLTALLAIAMTATALSGCALSTTPSSSSDAGAATAAQSQVQQSSEVQVSQQSSNAGQGSANFDSSSEVAQAEGSAGAATGDLASSIKIGDTYTLYNSSLNKYYLLMVLKNTSSTAASVNVDCVFFDSNSSVLGTSKQNCTVFAGGTEIVLRFDCDDQFSKYEYKISAKEKPSYYAPVVQNLTYKTDIKDKKVILSVTNNGKVAAEFVQFHMLFFSGNKLVYDGWGFCDDSDNQIKPGSTEYKEVTNYSNSAFDSVKVYLDSRAKV